MTMSHTSLIWHQRHQYLSKSSNFLLLLIFLLLSPRKVLAVTSLTCAAEPNIAYVNNNSNQEPKPLMRAWMCHGRTHREMIEKLASVSNIFIFILCFVVNYIHDWMRGYVLGLTLCLITCVFINDSRFECLLINRIIVAYSFIISSQQQNDT